MNSKFYVGVIRQERQSYAWCDVPEIEKPIRVNLKFLKKAMDGDEVLIKIKDGKYGFVQRVTKKSEKVLTGQLQLNKGFGFIKPWTKNFYKDFFVDKKHINGAKDGDVIEFKYKDWKGKSKSPLAKITKVLSNTTSPSKQLMYKLDIPTKFPTEVLQEIDTVTINESDYIGRVDLRYLEIFSIDPDGCTDVDDALSIERLEGGYRVGVHIADVSHYVRPGTELDKEAYKRSFTTYFPNFSIPMIPRKLSSDLCSLLEGQDRLAVSLFIDIDKDWNIIDTDVKRSVINNRKVFTYDEAQKLKEDTSSEYYTKLNNLYNIGRKVRNDNFGNEIELELPDFQWQIDENENPVKLKVKKRIETMDLIQSWMLMANKIVTQMVEKYVDIPWIYRVHPEIPEENIDMLKIELKQFGEEWDDLTSISENVKRLLTTDESVLISELLIKKFKPAKYSPEKTGHFSLGSDDYTHFTSPIRRYTDVIIHRILLQCVKGKDVYSADLERDCNHISVREKEVDRVCRTYNQTMCMKFVKNIDYALNSKVSYSTKKGLLIKTELMIDGWIPSKVLSEMDMKFNEETRRWDNVYGEEFFIGQQVRVKIDRLNWDKNEIVLKFS